MASAAAAPRSHRLLLIAFAAVLVAAVALALSGGAGRGAQLGERVGARSAEPVAGVDLGVLGKPPAIAPTQLLTDSGLVQTESMSSVSRRLHVAWPKVEGQPALDASLRSNAQRAIKAFTTQYAPPAPSQVSGIPELNSRWLSVGVSESVVGFLNDQVLNVSDARTSTWSTTWYSLAERRPLSTSDLVTSRATLARQVARHLPAQHPGITLTPRQMARMPVLAFTVDGRLLAGFNKGEGAGQRFTVVLSKAETDALLTAHGRLAQAAATTPSVPIASAAASAAPTAQVAPMGGPVDCRVAKCIALTFDDGPGPETNKLLGILADRKAPATFFVLGRQVAAYPQELRAEVAAGHQIGVHTWDHRQMPTLSRRQIDQELLRTVKIIEATAKVRPTVFRPPYGATNHLIERRAAAAGLSQILWNIDTMDWSTQNTASTQRIASRARPGSIVLMHDIQPSTIPAVGAMIDALRQRGLTPVTIDTLLGATKPGATYFDGIVGEENPTSKRKASWGQ